VLEITAFAWGITVALIVVLLAVDLGLAAARPHAVGFREAALSSIFYIAVAIVFGVVSSSSSSS
jgi:tellurite resistance protein TerC